VVLKRSVVTEVQSCKTDTKQCFTKLERARQQAKTAILMKNTAKLKALQQISLSQACHQSLTSSQQNVKSNDTRAPEPSIGKTENRLAAADTHLADVAAQQQR
jgi:hypothetical protein